VKRQIKSNPRKQPFVVDPTAKSRLVLDETKKTNRSSCLSPEQVGELNEMCSALVVETTKAVKAKVFEILRGLPEDERAEAIARGDFDV
jgi:hypothetical protein